jgi:large subunit ribosomal protein L30
MAGTLKLRQIRSLNHASRKQRDTLRTLRLGRIGKRSEVPDEPAVRGQLTKVGHLIEVEQDG